MTAASFLALGDSYTIGEGVAPAERWPAQLAALLTARGVPVAEPQVIARTGWTTDELAAGIAAATQQGTFDLVSLLIGVNNQYRGRPLDEYQDEFGALLTTAAWFAGEKVSRLLVLSIPDWGVTPFAAGRDAVQIAREIDAFNAAAHRIVTARGARWVDITGISRERHDGWLAADGLHMSARQYAAWAAAALDAARAALSTR